jgi:UDP-N-acetylglucosamine--N-acetylmuramyl-(pentapeptide) pyrophosphoryl-undecaprenol N-acetylglucosamine transferase
MKILAVGGGSGGHVTPVVAVAKEIQKKVPNVDFLFVCDKKFANQAIGLFSETDVEVKTICAGKLRRYANLKWYTYLAPYHIWHTHLANLVDLFKIGVGFCQASYLLRKFKPDVVFIKGGYVSLPLGLVAAKRHVPIVIHDSDVLPGLANKILAPYATAIGTGSPIENYPNYPRAKTQFVGIPVDANLFVELTKDERSRVLAKFGFSDKYPFVVITGGGGGSKIFNDLTVGASPSFIKSQIQVLLLTGKSYPVSKHFEDKFFRIEEFSNELGEIFRAANVVVTRAGASSLAELAAAKKAVVLIPHPYLSGNHQEKNAELYEKAAAAVVLNQKGLTQDKFFKVVNELAKDPIRQKILGRSLSEFAKPNALSDMVQMILKVVGKNGQEK